MEKAIVFVKRIFIATLRGQPSSDVLKQFLDLFNIHTAPSTLTLREKADRLAGALLKRIPWARAFLPFRRETEDIPSTLDILANVLEGG